MEGSGGPVDGPVDRSVDVVVPLKRLHQAKSRLTAASAGLPGTVAERDGAHRALVLALARDTLAAARAARHVRRLIVVTPEDHLDLEGSGGRDPAIVPGPCGPGLEIVPDPGGGLNAALRAGAAHLRARGPHPGVGRPGGSAPPGPARAIATLQADLPGLRPDELDDALVAALARLVPGPAAPRASGRGRPGGDRATAAFVADRQGTGTTLLVTAPGRTPEPHFGPDSAAAHRAAGAVALAGPWPGLRADVDTPADLARVREMGCGSSTSAWPRRVLAVSGRV